MLRRVLAWILLAGFVLLLVNIAIFQVLLVPSIVVYVLIAIWFIFNNKPLPSRRKKNNSENADVSENSENITDPSERKIKE